jgi:hypothetical protein
MHIQGNHLKSLTSTIMEEVALPVWPKSEKTNNFTVYILNRKDFTVTADMNKYEDKDLFKEHLMLNVW